MLPYEMVSVQPLTASSHGVSIPGHSPCQAQSLPGLTAAHVEVVPVAVSVVPLVVVEVVAVSVVGDVVWVSVGDEVVDCVSDDVEPDVALVDSLGAQATRSRTGTARTIETSED
jgi:hypothetical protein